MRQSNYLFTSQNMLISNKNHPRYPTQPLILNRKNHLFSLCFVHSVQKSELFLFRPPVNQSNLLIPNNNHLPISVYSHWSNQSFSFHQNRLNWIKNKNDISECPVQHVPECFWQLYFIIRGVSHFLKLLYKLYLF